MMHGLAQRCTNCQLLYKARKPGTSTDSCEISDSEALEVAPPPAPPSPSPSSALLCARLAAACSRRARCCASNTDRTARPSTMARLSRRFNCATMRTHQSTAGEAPTEPQACSNRRKTAPSWLVARVASATLVAAPAAEPDVSLPPCCNKATAESLVLIAALIRA